jgi:hypothetical protein
VLRGWSRGLLGLFWTVRGCIDDDGWTERKTKWMRVGKVTFRGLSEGVFLVGLLLV